MPQFSVSHVTKYLNDVFTSKNVRAYTALNTAFGFKGKIFIPKPEDNLHKTTRLLPHLEENQNFITNDFNER